MSVIQTTARIEACAHGWSSSRRWVSVKPDLFKFWIWFVFICCGMIEASAWPYSLDLLHWSHFSPSDLCWQWACWANCCFSLCFCLHLNKRKQVIPADSEWKPFLTTYRWWEITVWNDLCLIMITKSICWSTCKPQDGRRAAKYGVVVQSAAVLNNEWKPKCHDSYSHFTHYTEYFANHLKGTTIAFHFSKPSVAVKCTKWPMKAAEVFLSMCIHLQRPSQAFYFTETHLLIQ